MKKLLLLFSVVMAAFAVNAQTYYMAGNGTADNNWCCGVNWGDPDETPNKCPMTGSGNNWSYETTVPAAVIEGGAQIVLKSSVPFGSATITSWTIVGPSWLMGSEWDTNDTSNDMKNTSGSTWTLVKSGVAFDPSDVENGTIGFKAVANHSYSVGQIPGPNSDASMDAPTEAGTYDFTFTLDVSLQSVSGTFAKSTGSAVDETSAAVVTAANGTVYADGELVIYDLVGNNVTAENGNLKGVYVVVVDGVSSKINVQ